MKNESIYLVRDQQFTYRDSQMPTPGDKDVVVEIRHIGVCGSDVAFFTEHTMHGALDFELPIILGHECAGVVVQTGAGVEHLKVGDRVALEPGVPCGTCKYCRSGHYNVCPDVDFMAAPPFHSGAMSRYVRHPEAWCYKLPDHVSTMEGALLEPLAVGMYAVKRADPQLGSLAVILGAGCIGLVTLLSLKARGIDNIVVADLFDNRLEMAKQLGAKYTVNSKNTDLKEYLMQLTQGCGADYVFETAGAAATTAVAGGLVARSGKIVQVGQVHAPVAYDFFEIGMKEADILSVFRYANIYPAALEAVASGRVDVKQIVTKVFPWEQAQQAFECALHNKQDVVKIVIEC